MDNYEMLDRAWEELSKEDKEKVINAHKKVYQIEEKIYTKEEIEDLIAENERMKEAVKKAKEYLDDWKKGMYTREEVKQIVRSWEQYMYEYPNSGRNGEFYTLEKWFDKTVK